jgi:hypothetical protein
MRLAKAVVSDSGITLVREGTELTTPLIDRLGNLGIRRIVVHGRPLETGDEIEKPLAVLEKELEERFRPTRSNPLMQQLKEVFLRDLYFWASKEEQQVEHTD